MANLLAVLQAKKNFQSSNHWSSANFPHGATAAMAVQRSASYLELLQPPVSKPFFQ